ncbi:ABC transporter ATP-binding protein [candidate division WOR-3 bacterium]|nr:ABC transporter ATP-binding protein [candidate division WOR-3 bacterium]
MPEGIKIQQITKIYKTGSIEVNALINVSLNIKKGEFISIAGPSGSGKTTLLNLIGCIDEVNSGEIIIDERDVTKLNDNQLALFRNKYIGFVFQDFNLIPVLTVYENVEFSLAIHPELKNNHKKLIMDALKNVGIEDLYKRFPRELSGGQKQRVAIARALVKNPLIVLADEPTANLDSKNASNIMDIMKKMNEKYKTTFIFSTHDNLVMDYAKRIVYLRDGEITEDTVK